ncbi:hypothetical protein COY65_01535 [Candidatus Jorgensenbacteria bacterium CG_4_10_14_0_8_um_filter_39_13]|uniref:ComEC/Rec2-related protein domain-containing protein n=2 Tax=Candidatus Joergenseniibacteriota TaxID=1752739 RepID=A0A2M7RHB9_9BACT|nr:MAG: hypothetical protein COV54_01090 [Candidatus Jorgensenbacteria bacterium CG11_big_fil_rev_8_21_14_0_20_38_23]PIW97479.1 MAG: hypothetical protein COZ81_02410 [Candidatus Jorgensenbacteria bacterium CG_4_8_14_3_um_filter_38_10]PIY96114.1 MAG: hypothetical protein COY65_01535 [Candidatus Jorgensenbacteria bacterium CG_4_10_14_0_8_um_filter_39_13]PJA95112.1 MAG: hypothetical protein CO130_00870 [Candidatus Jorgensenbacteria bacterium CG_4_9_14_3_um_filter_38_10]
MRISDLVFYFVLFFLGGILLASLEVNFLIIISVVGFLALGFFILRLAGIPPSSFWQRLSILSLMIIIGVFYYHLDNVIFQKHNLITFNQKLNFQGLVVDNPLDKNGFQEAVIELSPPWQGKVSVKLASYPEIAYGDKLNFIGGINQVPSSTSKYLAKERIAGVSSFPQFSISGRGYGSAIKSGLFKLNDKIVSIFKKFLPSTEAAFLAGLTFGQRSDFSLDFKKSLNLSGTTHLVALSGYNISIIALTVAALFGRIFPRRISFALTVLVIIGFVLMTGAQASVVRAALMAALALLAKEIGRPNYDVRNAIVFTGFLMVLVNPKILAFDVGFQLSFLALLGIVYLKPVLIKIFRLSESPGFLSWRENFLTTTSAQLAVIPILISNFGLFSLTSLLANVLVLEFVPLTMFLGFLMAAVNFISYYLTMIVSWLVLVSLKFEILVINIFSKLTIPLAGSKNISLMLFLGYYLFLAAIIFYAQRFYRKNLAEAEK